jgi:peptide/nickel transport system substrate-binding protein
LRKVRRGLFHSLLYITLIILIAGCSNSNSNTNEQQPEEENKEQGMAQKGGELVLGYVTDISNFDPIYGTKGYDHALLWPIYDTLVRFNPGLEPEPGLATNWEIPDDRTIILSLREGVKFHDGTEFDAEAVKFNLERANSEDSKVSDLKSIESIEVVDKHTVTLHLSKPDSSIILALSDRGGMMVSPAAIEKHGVYYSQNPAGAGPYKLYQHVPNGEIVYEAFESYWEEGKPYLDKMIVKIMPDENTRINALRAGEIDYAYDISPANIPTLESNSNIVIKEVTGVLPKQFFINTSMAPLDKKEVRLALLHGINREALLKSIGFGRGELAFQQFPRDYWAANKEMKIDYNPEKSIQLLKDAGIEKVKLKVVHSPEVFYQSLGEALKNQLQEIGIELELEAMESTATVTRYFSEKTVHAFLSNWSGRPDPHMTINSLYSSNSFYNPGGVSTQEIEDLIEKAAGTYDQSERGEIYAEINRIAILEEALEIPIMFNPRTSAMDKRVMGYEPNLMGKPMFSNIWIKK